MATLTTNLHASKPTDAEAMDITVLNANADLVDARLARIVLDVKDARFGAVGDGVANDGPAIQAALDAAGVGGAVYLPPSAAGYKSNQRLGLLDDQMIFSWSSRLCRIDFSGAAAHGIGKKAGAAKADNVAIRGLTLRVGTTAATSTFYGVDLEDCNYARLEDVTVEYGLAGFHLKQNAVGCFFNHLHRCRAQACKYGIDFDDGGGAGNPSNACTVENFVYEDTGPIWGAGGAGTGIGLRLSGYGHKIIDFYCGGAHTAGVTFGSQCGECVLIGLYVESGPTVGLDAFSMNGTTRRNIVIGVHFDTAPGTAVLDPNKGLLLLHTDESTFAGGPTLSHDEPFLELRSTDVSGKRWRLVSGGGAQASAGQFGLYNDTDSRLVVAVDRAAPASSLVVNASGHLLVNSGAALQKILTGTTTWDPPSIANGGFSGTTVTVTGAVVGDPVSWGFSNNLANLTPSAWVSAANTVTVKLSNDTGAAVDLASGTVKALVFKV